MYNMPRKCARRRFSVISKRNKNISDATANNTSQCERKETVMNFGLQNKKRISNAAKIVVAWLIIATMITETPLTLFMAAYDGGQVEQGESIQDVQESPAPDVIEEVYAPDYEESDTSDIPSVEENDVSDIYNIEEGDVSDTPSIEDNVEENNIEENHEDEEYGNHPPLGEDDGQDAGLVSDPEFGYNAGEPEDNYWEYNEVVYGVTHVQLTFSSTAANGGIVTAQVRHPGSDIWQAVTSPAMVPIGSDVRVYGTQNTSWFMDSYSYTGNAWTITPGVGYYVATSEMEVTSDVTFEFTQARFTITPNTVDICNTTYAVRVDTDGTAIGEINLNPTIDDLEFEIVINDTVEEAYLDIQVLPNVIITEARTVEISVIRQGITQNLTINLSPSVENLTVNNVPNIIVNDQAPVTGHASEGVALDWVQGTPVDYEDWFFAGWAMDISGLVVGEQPPADIFITPPAAMPAGFLAMYAVWVDENGYFVTEEACGYQIAFHIYTGNQDLIGRFGHYGTPNEDGILVINVPVAPGTPLSQWPDQDLLNVALSIGSVHGEIGIPGHAFWGWFQGETLDSSGRFGPTVSPSIPNPTNPGLRRPSLADRCEWIDGGIFTLLQSSSITQTQIDNLFANGTLDLFAIWSLWGDVNDDDIVDFADLNTLEAYLLSGGITNINVRAADVFNNNIVDWTDVGLLQSYLLTRDINPGRVILGAPPMSQSLPFASFNARAAFEPMSIAPFTGVGIAPAVSNCSVAWQPHSPVITVPVGQTIVDIYFTFDRPAGVARPMGVAATSIQLLYPAGAFGPGAGLTGSFVFDEPVVGLCTCCFGNPDPPFRGSIANVTSSVHGGQVTLGGSVSRLYYLIEDPWERWEYYGEIVIRVRLLIPPASPVNNSEIGFQDITIRRGGFSTGDGTVFGSGYSTVRIVRAGTDAPPLYHAVTFNLDGGVRTGGGELQQSVLSGGDAVPPQFTDRPGYTFNGWNVSYTNITRDRIITALWTPGGGQNFTVTFDPAGGTRESGGELTQQVASGENAELPILAYRSGWNFLGWSPEGDHLNVTSTRNLTAQWEQVTQSFTVTFDPAGGAWYSGGALEQQVASGDDAELPVLAYRSGWNFLGWSPEGDHLNVTSARNLTAQWEQVTQGFTVTFDPAGGTRESGGELTQQVASGDDAELPILAARTGWNFLGWAPEGDYLNVTSARNLTAQWEQYFVVTFDPAGGTRESGGELTQEVVSSENAELPILATRPGWNFLGWTPEGDYLNVTSTRNLTAQWEQYFVVTFDPAGGAWYSGGALEQQVVSGDDAELPILASRPGWNFLGWTPEGDYLNVTSARNLTAQWQQIMVGYTFNWNVSGVLDVTGTVAWGTAPTAPTGVTREGFTFGGWSPIVGPITTATTFNAIWNPIIPGYVSYTFNWNAPGVTNVIGTVQPGNTPAAPTGVTRDGFTFGGWYPVVGPIEVNTTFNAIWDTIYVNYTFNWNVSGVPNATGTVAWGTAPTAPTGVTRAGYTFGGWYPVVGPITTTTIFNATWNTIYVDFTFNWNVSGVSDITGTVAWGTAPSIPTGVTRSGYTFGGWSPVVGPITTATTFNAIWNPVIDGSVSFTFNWNAPGASNVTGTVQPGNTPPIPTGVTRTGYTFGGWSPVVGPITSNTTFNAIWNLIPPVYVGFTFNWNISGMTNVSGVVQSGQTPIAPTGVTRAGYTFGGWSPAVGPITAHETFNAIWTPIPVNFTFYCNVLGIISTGTVASGETPISPTPTRLNYVLVGWTPGIGPITVDTTFTAVWNPVMVNYTFYCTVLGVISTGSVPFGGMPTLVSDPIRAGYTFGGWSPNAGPLTSDTTFFAIWNPDVAGYVSYTFNWNVAGVANVSNTIPSGGTPTQPSIVPANPGYTFDGWCTPVGPITANQTFNAIWIPVPVNFTFYCTVLGTIAAGTVASGEAPLAPTPTLLNHVLVGWTPGVGPITTDTTFIAIWNMVEVSFTFYCEYNSVVHAGTVSFGGTPTAPAAPSRPGYEFGGWSIVVQPITTTTIFNAIWNVVPETYVSYTFNWNYAGAANVTGTIQSGGTPTAPTGITRDGFTFGGWYPIVEPITENTTFNAIWNTIYVSYTFNWGISSVSNVTGTVAWGTAPTAPTGVTRSGYTFGGWSPIVGPITTNTIFVAQWTPISSVTNVNFTFLCTITNRVFSTGTVQSGATPTRPANPTRNGFAFAGWSPAVGPITSNTTFTAQWTPVSGGAGGGSGGGASGGGSAGGGTTQQQQTPPAQTPPAQAPASQPEYQPDVDIDLDIEQQVEQFHARFMVGDDRGNFRPNHSITRAEAATIMVRTMSYFGITPRPVDASARNMFSDINPNAWYAEYVAAAYSNGLIQGFPDGTFRPNQAISREQFAAMIARTGTVRPNGSLNYTDASRVSGWATNYVYTAFVLGMMRGDTVGTFRPLENITRAEAAATLARALGRGDTTAQSIAGVTNVHRFPDASNASLWHYFYVIEATNSHWFIMNGDVEIWTRVTN